MYEKKILYFTYGQNEGKEKPPGFVRILRENYAYILDIHIRFEEKVSDQRCTLFLVIGGREMEWEPVRIRDGSIEARKELMLCGEEICMEQARYREALLQGIVLYPDGKRRVAAYLKPVANLEKKMTVQKEDEMQLQETLAEEAAEWREIPANEELHGEPELTAEEISEDKWEQLLKNYQQVHPFGDERVFLSIEPKDFVILQSAYQKLVNNSFLLHGFYNYRHVILGPDEGLGGGGEQFYLGVPGTYFEREKMVAVMFGFEGFECSGAVEIGKQGYYMRRVEI